MDYNTTNDITGLYNTVIMLVLYRNLLNTQSALQRMNTHM